MDELTFSIFAAAFGLMIGSFLSVCIYRIPHGRVKGLASLSDEFTGDDGEDVADEEPAVNEEPDESSEALSIFYPRRSFCPNCKEQLKWYHNIPLFGWLILGGQCAFCKDKISFRYPLVELLSAITCVYSFQFFPPATAALVYIFCCALIVITFIDIDYYIIPNVITYPGMILAAIIGVGNGYLHWFSFPISDGVMSSFWGLIAGGGFLWLVAKIFYLVKGQMGLGFGDVKLLALVGLLFGPDCALYTIFIGSLIGSVVGGLTLMLLGAKFNRPLPFGPYLAAGTILYIFTFEIFPISFTRGF